MGRAELTDRIASLRIDGGERAIDFAFPPLDLDGLERLAAARSSCRAYRTKEVPKNIVEQLLRIAGQSPSWCNVQPWVATVLSGRARLDLGERLLAAFDEGGARDPDIAFPADYSGHHADRRRESGFALYQALGIDRADRAARAAEMRRNFDFFGAPHVLLLSAPAELGAYGLLDCGLFVGSFLLAAQAAGLGAVAQGSVALYSGLLRDALALSDDRRILCAVAFDYPEADHAANTLRTTRVAVGEFANLVRTLPRCAPMMDNRRGS